MSRTLLLMYPVHTEHLRRLQSIAPDWEILHTTDKEEAATLIENAEVVMGNHNLTESLPFNKTIKWIQTNSVGVDMILKPCLSLLNNVILTNAKGVYNDEISEHTLALVLLLQRNLHLLRDAQHDHKWERPYHLPLLKNKNVLIAGYGSLGRSIGEKLQQFGCNIYGINTGTQYVSFKDDQSTTGKHWKDILPQVDILIICLPSTSETLDYIGKEELKKLPASAFVINIGRPETINEKTLFDMLKTNRLRGAALDVFDDEPLDKDHSAWDIKNLFVSPHMARTREIDPPFQFEKLFEENFKRYVTGSPLLNIVNIQKGY